MRALNRIISKLDTGRVVLLGGATGTELARRGANFSKPLWSAQALLDNPKLVREIHTDYIRAGAEIVIANTFRTARVTLAEAGYGNLADELPDMAVSLLLLAIESENAQDRVVPTGCLSPLLGGTNSSQNLTDTELEGEHEEHAVRQTLAGAELIAVETMVTVREAVIALRAAKAAGVPAIVSFVPTDARHIMSGETIDTAVRAVEPLRPLAISLNCCPTEIMDKALPTLRSLTNLPVGAYAHMGIPGREDQSKDESEITATQYAARAEEWVERGLNIIGTCCGSTPEFTAALYERLIMGKEGK
ncbi:MAG TPA: homocysteine S-methyltransferase family protein [Acidobacteriota bacterium]|nr:homocysteine S-methyltransferase family protein [Acidobacteriota bacterium]